MFLFTLAVANAGLISHDGFGKATSYQNIEFHHFHAAPTYVKKEDSHLLKHPLPAGKSQAKLEVHHGDKHDHGYAFAQAHSDVHGLGIGGHDFGLGGHEEGGNAALLTKYLGGHQSYDVKEHNVEYEQGLGHGGQESYGFEGGSLGHFQQELGSHGQEALGHYHQEISSHGQEALGLGHFH